MSRPSHPKSPDLGVRLRRCRLAAGLTLRELAFVTGNVTAAYLSRVETGTRSPSLELLIELAKPLHTTGLYLLMGKDDVICPCCGRGPAVGTIPAPIPE